MEAVPKEERKQHDAGAMNDLLAGWGGGALGILVSNPFEVLKVRLQTARVPSPRVGAGSRASQPSPPPKPSPGPVSSFTSNPHPTSATAASASSTKLPPPPAPSLPHQAPGSGTGLAALWKAEGVRFLFAGAAGPIIGLAFLDSAFFGGYGRAMAFFNQDRSDPSALSRVFLSGAASGAVCALLQTPVEVVKCRAQAEGVGADGKKKGSFKIAKTIAQEGVRGFWIGGLMTACRDSLSSGLFFWGYFVFRRALRGEPAFRSSQKPIPKAVEDGHLNKSEIMRMLLAGGIAGSLSAVVPYPLDIIKTRLQTANVESRAHHHPALSPSSSPSPKLPPPPPPPSKPLTVTKVARGIHSDGKALVRYRYSSTVLYSFLSGYVFPPSRSKGAGNLVDGRPAANPKAEKWAVRILGLKGFLRGITPTVASSFVGSAVTITTFELALLFLGGESEA